MKPSHYTTPRTLSDCYFDPRGQAIFVPEGLSPNKQSKSLFQWLLSLFR